MRDVHGEKREARLRRHARVRRKISGTAEMPRLAVYRSLNHIYAQLIDDEAGRTIASASSLRLELPAVEPPASAEAPEGGDKKGGKKKGGKKKARPASLKVRRSTAVGTRIAELAKEKGISKARFDRGGYLYHGRVAALAEAARKNGLEI